MDNQLALIYGDLSISWFALFAVAGCLAGMLLACMLRKISGKNASDMFVLVTFAAPIALIFARIQYCMFADENFSNTYDMLNLSNGGYGLYGAILGVFAAAVLVNLIFKMGGVGSLMDCTALGGALAITVGRFATQFTGTEIGYEVSFDVFAVPDASGTVNNLAVYMLDGILEAVVLAVCLIFYIIQLVNKNEKALKGTTALLVLALHGTNQVVMDSLRSDALKLGANDFIKISQIIGILTCVAVIVYFMVKVIKRDKFKKYNAWHIVVIVACIVLGILSEYRVGNCNYISKHILMLVCMVVLAALTVWYGARAVKPSLAVETPTDEVPDAVTPAIETTSESPVTEEPAKEETVIDVPAAQKTAIEVPVAEESVVEIPVEEISVEESSAVEEPAVESTESETPASAE